MESTVIERIDTEWTDLAQCRGTDQRIFFPSQEYYEGTEAWTELVSIAKSLCRACPVVPECLDYALTTRQKEGVWGGMTPSERRTRHHNK